MSGYKAPTRSSAAVFLPFSTVPPGRHINLLVALACCAVRDTHTLRYFLYSATSLRCPMLPVGCNRGWLVVAYQITQLRIRSNQHPSTSCCIYRGEDATAGQTGGLSPANWGLRVGVYRVLIEAFLFLYIPNNGTIYCDKYEVFYRGVKPNKWLFLAYFKPL